MSEPTNEFMGELIQRDESWVFMTDASRDRILETFNKDIRRRMGQRDNARIVLDEFHVFDEDETQKAREAILAIGLYPRSPELPAV